MCQGRHAKLLPLSPPGLPALIVIGTCSANSYGPYAIRNKENIVELELGVVAVGAWGIPGPWGHKPGPEGNPGKTDE